MKKCKEASDTALRWSFWIWMGKDKNEWFAQKSSGEAPTKNKDAESMTGMVDADFEAGAVLLVEEELSPSTGGD